MFDRGAIVLVPYPYTDLKATKTRPVLVLTDRARNAADGDIVVCGITSNLRDSPGSVLIDGGDLARGRLPRPSRIKVSKLLTVHPAVIRKEVGRVKPEVMQQVWKELQALLAP